MKTWIDDFCPPRHRLLYQAVGAKTSIEAHAEVRRIFNRDDAVYVPGAFRIKRPYHNTAVWEFVSDGGFMAFVPLAQGLGATR